nr:hypothetical protein [Roseburia inulinivorans]
MGFRLAVSGGAESISLDERTIEKLVSVLILQQIPTQGQQISVSQ